MISENQLGINIVNSNNNAIYHNDFMDNTIAFQLSNSTSPGNSWDNGYPSGGNYWSTWTGPTRTVAQTRTFWAQRRHRRHAIHCCRQQQGQLSTRKTLPTAQRRHRHRYLGQDRRLQGYCCNITLIILDYGLYGETFNMAIWVSH